MEVEFNDSKASVRNDSIKRQKKVVQGAWWMPWLTEAMKDVISCDKPRVGANIL